MDDRGRRPTPDDPTLPPAEWRPGAAPSGVPPEIEGYRLLEKIGEGGMGEVWIAEQLRPVHRRVAVKLIKPGMDSREVVARFESERQALALMSHPSIARVFDAGTTREGRPYFAMELVRGLPLTEHCDRARLPTGERITLFLRICAGVQHAHQKGIIHRDLKPANLLVELQDGQPVPKIIDFGIAKALDQRLTERTVYTQLGVMIGTPDYMSPEQAGTDFRDVDVRSDVYSLGVVLYELLAGHLPHGPTNGPRGSVEEIRRRIREEEPRRPSTQLSRSGEAAEEAARRRGTDARTLARRLRGDLDWIVLKCLEKDPARRYAAVGELAADLERFLTDRPVLAGPPGAAYRLRKFVRRHRLAVAAGAVALLTLAVGLVGTTVGLVRARRAEAVAQREAETARRVVDLLTAMFEVADPTRSRGETITAREVLDRGVGQLTSGLAAEPEVKATLLTTAGKVYASLGLWPRAAALQEECVALRRATAADPAALAQCLDRLARVRAILGDFPAAERAATEAVALGRAGGEAKLLAAALSALAYARFQQSDLDAAAAGFEEALALLREAGAGESGEAAAVLTHLGAVETVRRRLPEARRRLEQAAAIERTLARPGEIPGSIQNLAIVLYYLGDYAGAETLNREIAEAKRRQLGEGHPDFAYALDNLGEVLFKQGRFAEAEQLHGRALAILRQAVGETPGMGLTLYNLGLVREALGRPAEAEQLLRESLELRRRYLRSPNPDLAASAAALGRLLAARGRPDEGRDLLRQAQADLAATLGPEHPDTLAVAAELARLGH